MTNNNSSSGMIYPTIQSMPGPNPRESTIIASNASNQKLNDLIKSTSGGKNGKKRILKRGGSESSNIVVPQFTMMYPTQGRLQTPNNNITNMSKTITQSNANSAYDNLATVQNGGNIYMNPNTNKYQWGCYSGGKKYRRYNSMKIKTKNKRNTKQCSKQRTRKLRKIRSRRMKKSRNGMIKL
jgi:hypothetical protein